MYFNCEGGRLFYTDNGKGRAIVLLHGYLESSEVWNGFAERLSAHFRVICIDHPGHGHSSVFKEAHTMEFVARVVSELLESLALQKVFMAGHSLGGYVTLAYLELFPENLNGYCLLHSHPFADTPEALDKRRREIEIVNAGKKEIMYPGNIKRMFADLNVEQMAGEVERLMMIASALSGEGIVAVLKGMMVRPSRLNIMEEGRVPLLWILGTMDNYISCDGIQARVTLPGNAKVAILKGSGHMGFLEEQELSVRELSDFVNSLE